MGERRNPAWALAITVFLSLIIGPSLACLISAMVLRSRNLEFIWEANLEQNELLARRDARRWRRENPGKSDEQFRKSEGA